MAFIWQSLDTGWGKALWGKMYGQWLCEATIFTYDYNEFFAKEIELYYQV